jgi:alpha-galactosidase
MHGFNDYVDGWSYPEQAKPGGYDEYARLLEHLIRDVRRDLGAPKLPCVIGVMGIGGVKAGDTPPQRHFREAQVAPLALPEFKGNVAAVQTAPFWSEELGAIDQKREKVSQMAYFLRTRHRDHANKDGTMSPEQQREYLKQFEADLITPAEAALWKRGASDAGYHYLGCAKTFAQMGQAFAEALLKMRPPASN